MAVDASQAGFPVLEALSGPGTAKSSRRLTRSMKLGWVFGEVALASHMTIISVYLLFYLTDILKLPAALAGSLVLLPRLWNIVTDPLMGTVSDRIHSRWGRRRPFLLAGSILWGASFCAMFWIPIQSSEATKAIWFLVSYLIVNTGLSLYHVPYSAMAPEMTRDSAERLALMGWKEIAARLAVLLSVAGSPLLVRMAPDPITGHRWVGVAAGAIITLSGLVAFFSTRHAPLVAFQHNRFNWREELRTLKANKPLLALSGVYLATCATDAFYSAMFLYLVTAVLHLDASTMGLFYPVGSLAAMAMTPVWAWLGRRIGKKRACILSFGCLVASFVPALGLSPGHNMAVIGFVIPLGASFAGLFLLPSAMLLDVIDHDERISGGRREGTIYGAWIFTQQTGMAFGTFLVGVYLDLIGYRAGSTAAATAYEINAIRLGFVGVPALLLLSAIFLIKTYRLPSKRDGLRDE